jgi:hypothetical protein
MVSSSPAATSRIEKISIRPRRMCSTEFGAHEWLV